MANFCFLSVSPEAFDCVLCMIYFLGMDSLITFSSYNVEFLLKHPMSLWSWWLRVKMCLHQWKCMVFISLRFHPFLKRDSYPHWIPSPMSQELSRSIWCVLVNYFSQQLCGICHFLLSCPGPSTIVIPKPYPVKKPWLFLAHVHFPHLS